MGLALFELKSNHIGSIMLHTYIRLYNLTNICSCGTPLQHGRAAHKVHGFFGTLIQQFVFFRYKVLHVLMKLTRYTVYGTRELLLTAQDRCNIILYKIQYFNYILSFCQNLTVIRYLNFLKMSKL